jgi:hypothetical protein
MVKVHFTDTAKEDVRTYIQGAARQVELVGEIAGGLRLFPARHRSCPPESGFGDAARFFYHRGFTIVYDLYGIDNGVDQDVWIRHIWPAASLRTSGLLT